MKINKYSFVKNKKAVVHPLEFLVAFGVLVISFLLIFSAVSHIFIPYKTDEFILRAKAMAISERLIKDVGKAEDGSSDWELDITNLKCLGLASHIILNDTWYITWEDYPSPPIADSVDRVISSHHNSSLLPTINDLKITKYTYKNATNNIIRIKNVVSNRTDYGTLDSDKIDALNKVQYNDAKAALGLELEYDFNIVINDVNDRELLKYGKSYGDADVIESFTRNVRVYLAYKRSTTYTEAELIVYVF
jgi:hypothetical protein